MKNDGKYVGAKPLLNTLAVRYIGLMTDRPWYLIRIEMLGECQDKSKLIWGGDVRIPTDMKPEEREAFVLEKVEGLRRSWDERVKTDSTFCDTVADQAVKLLDNIE